MTEHERIWLEPAGAPDRCWCQDNQWGDEGVEYVLASTIESLQRENEELRQRLDIGPCGEDAIDVAESAADHLRHRAEAAESEVKRVTESRDGYKRGRDSIQAEYDRLRASHSDEIEALTDKIEGLSADLDSAVGVAFNRGAHEWVRMNYPDRFEKLSSQALASTGRDPLKAFDALVTGPSFTEIASTGGEHHAE